MATVTSPLVMDATLNTTDSTPVNLADVMQTGLANIVTAIGSGGGSGGHTIIDSEGTSMTQRDNMQFIGAYVSDNSTDETTEVEVVREMTQSAYNQLTSAEKEGFIIISDSTGSVGATDVAYDHSNSGLSATTVQSAIDEIQTEIGDTDISSIGDGTATGAISELNDKLANTYYSFTYTDSLSNATISNVSCFNTNNILALGFNLTLSASVSEGGNICDLQNIPQNYAVVGGGATGTCSVEVLRLSSTRVVLKAIGGGISAGDNLYMSLMMYLYD